MEHNRPDLIVCPMLKKFIPESIWATRRCLIVHPGPKGDRGPSSLDRAIELGKAEWRVTVLEANGEADAADIWATLSFSIRQVGKSSLYRHEVRSAAIDESSRRSPRWPAAPPQGLDPTDLRVTAQARPLMRQELRAIYWEAGIHRHGHSQDSRRRGPPRRARPDPGNRLSSVRRPSRAGAERARRRDHRPARRSHLRATVDGAVWVTHLKRGGGDPDTHFKLPATGRWSAGIELDAPEVPAPWHAPSGPAGQPTARSSRLNRRGGVAALRLLQRRDEH